MAGKKIRYVLCPLSSIKHRGMVVALRIRQGKKAGAFFATCGCGFRGFFGKPPEFTADDGDTEEELYELLGDRVVF